MCKLWCAKVVNNGKEMIEVQNTSCVQHNNGIKYLTQVLLLTSIGAGKAVWGGGGDVEMLGSMVAQCALYFIEIS